MPCNQTAQSLLESHLDRLAAAEDLAPDQIREALAAGRMVLLGNPAHANVRPTLVGTPASIKVNANLGTSAFICDVEAEIVKLRAAQAAGADAVMDLSTAGDLTEVRKSMLAASPLPLGTVPIYALSAVKAAKGENPADFTPDELVAEIAAQAAQGVNFMTVHSGLTRSAAETAIKNRDMGIVSRGGSILARWMREHDAENPCLTHFDAICEACRPYNVVLSLGDGLRPGALSDAGDAAQWEEVVMLARLARRADELGVQTMIEGPGHVPLHMVAGQIQTMKRLVDDRPLYVLGPLVVDSCPGYDHIGAAIGGAIAGTAGADFLCYVTPAEHLTLPDAEDVHQGVIASRIAARAAERASGRPRAVKLEAAVSKARRALDWESMTALAVDPDMVTRRRQAHAAEKECAMCGKLCAVRMIENC